MMAGRPEKNSARLRQALSTVYASDTRSGSREFHASSAARAFCAAVSRLKGGSGGRIRPLERLRERNADGPRHVGHGVRLLTAQGYAGVHRAGQVGRTLREACNLGALVERVVHEHLDRELVVAHAERKVRDGERFLLAHELALGG